MTSVARISLETFPPTALPALRHVSALCGSAPAWVVGGALRDALLGKPVGELDIAVMSGSIELGQLLSERLGAAGFVVLDRDRGVCRVVAELQIDIADLRAASLDEDLRARDFTVNALAASVHALVRDGSAPVEDATGGLDDLRSRTIRLCGPGSLEDDPLRALRAVRFAVQTGWSLHPSAESAIVAMAPRVAQVSAERVRDELVAILAEPSAGRGVRLLDRLGVLPILLPESVAMKQTAQPQPHRFDVWEHSLRAVEATDLLLMRLHALAPWGAALQAHLAEPLGDRLTRRETLKLAALLHDVSKPETRTVVGERTRFFGHDARGAERAAAIGQRWRLSRRATTVLTRLVAQHLRPMHLASASEITRRARHRFFRDLGDDARDLLLLSLVDAAAVHGISPLAVWSGAGGEVVRELMHGVAEETRAAEAPPLLRGEDVMTAFDLKPGPEVGRLLARAREAQALGQVATRDEALAYLRRERA